MSDYTIYSDDANKVRRLMMAYQASVKCEYVVLCHRDGNIIAEVGSLGVPPPDEAVAVLDGTLFPRGVGARVVDVAPDDGLYLLGIEELAAVVCRDAPHRP